MGGSTASESGTIQFSDSELWKLQMAMLHRRSIMGPAPLILLLLFSLPGPLWSVDLPGFVRGDANGDQGTDITDAISILHYLFGSSAEIPCLDAADSNDDGNLDLIDAIGILNLVFGSGQGQFPRPFGECGTDPTPDSLDCQVPPCTFGPVISERSFTLETGREGIPYLGNLPENFQDPVTWNLGPQVGTIREEIVFEEFGLPLDAGLPGDLVLDPATGTLTGSSTPPGVHHFELWGRIAGGALSLIHCTVPWLSTDEAEWIPGQDFSEPGPYPVSNLNSMFNYIHPLPWPLPFPLYSCSTPQPTSTEHLETKALRIYMPFGLDGPAPLLFFHHGTGFGWGDYSNLLDHLASHGIICVSLNDPYPYFGFSDIYCWGGHDEAARVMLEVRDLIGELETNPAHPISGMIDWNRVFYAGHSRGGASAMAACEMDPDVRGVIMLQGTDARRDSWVGYTNRWLTLPDVPVLSVTAEQDTDVIYPYSERILERFTGPSTMVTIYGGCHGFTSDTTDIGCSTCTWQETAPEVDNCSYITRDLQQKMTRHWVLAFLRRYAFDDLSTGGLLYGDENQRSPYVAVSSRSNLSAPIIVSDFENFPLSNLGLPIVSSNMILFESGPCYDWPFPLPQPIDPISNLICILHPSGISTIGLPFGSSSSALDIGPRKRLLLRLKNHDIHGALDNLGYTYESTLSLSDGNGQSASVNLRDFLPDMEFHPEPSPPLTQVRLKYQRFITISIPVEAFLAVEPLLDFNSLTGMTMEFVTDGSAGGDIRIGIDDIRFE